MRVLLPVLLVLTLPGCAGGSANFKPVIDIARAGCAVIEPICRVATSACGFVPPSSGDESPEE